MGNMNTSAFKRISAQYGIPCQLVLGNDARSTKGLIIGEYTLNGCSNWTVSDIEDFFAKAKKDGIHEAVQSVCKQKVNTAHGRTRMEQARHAGSQNGTYANRFEQVQLYKRNLYDVFVMYCMLDTINKNMCGLSYNELKNTIGKFFSDRTFINAWFNLKYNEYIVKVENTNTYIIGVRILEYQYEYLL